MSKFNAALQWKSGANFDPVNYDRSHSITYGSGVIAAASAAPEYKGDPHRLNPEEALLGALMSCHMLTFLAIAAKAKYIIESYDDAGSAQLGKNESGAVCVSEATLRPRIVFAGAQQPDQEQLRVLHEKAHQHCFVANTIRTRVTIEPQKRQ